MINSQTIMEYDTISETQTLYCLYLNYSVLFIGVFRISATYKM